MENFEQKFDNLELSRIELKKKSDVLIPAFMVCGVAFFLFLLYSDASGTELIVGIVFSIFLAIVANWYFLLKPFKSIKDQFKKIIVYKFMQSYHPDMRSSFSAAEKNGAEIADAMYYHKFNSWEEQNVLEGQLGDTLFYLSNIRLSNLTSDNDTPVFKGLLIHLKSKTLSFPDSQIISDGDLIESLFGGFQKNETYGFLFETIDPYLFDEKLAPLFPFINFLRSKYGKVVIRSHNNEIIVTIATQKQYLSDPDLILHKSFKNKEHFNRIGQKINTLLYMIESFTNHEKPEIIENNLKLKMKEILGKEI